MVRFLKLLRQIDIFGETIKLTFKKQETAKTVIGGITTLILILLINFILVIMSLEIFQKLKPVVTVEDIIQPFRPNMTLNKMTLPISVIVQDENNKIYHDVDKFTMEALTTTVVIEDNGTLTNTIENLNLILCEPSYFPSLTNDSFYNSRLNNYFCLENQNVSIGGYWDSNYTKYLRISIMPCRNSTESKVICAQESEIKEYFENTSLYFALYYQNTILNTQQYSNPTSPYIITNYKSIKYGSSRYNELYFRKDFLLSDNHFLLETSETTNVTLFDISNYAIANFAQDGFLVEFDFYSSNYKKIYRRSYLKIQAVLAQVGAISNILIQIGSVICYVFTKVRLNKHILNKIYDFDFFKMEDQVEDFKQIIFYSNL